MKDLMSAANILQILIIIADSAASIRYIAIRKNKRFFNKSMNSGFASVPELKDWALFMRLSSTKFGRIIRILNITRINSSGTRNFFSFRKNFDMNVRFFLSDMVQRRKYYIKT